MPGNGSDEDVTVELPLGNEGNRDLYEIVCDYKLNSHEHCKRLDAITDLLRDLTYAAPGHIGEEFLKEQERNHTRDGELLEDLNKYVRGT